MVNGEHKNYFWYVFNNKIVQSINQVLFLSFLPSFFLHLLHNKNKLREYWLPRITDKLIMIGSQYILSSY